ncbi:hypothetical protein DL98DRAFT_658206 [Cadophora sp. DSE1049]|nr:hypothetical protein DL98DRAFT_658206 [Cadophora sp. DSE1049]
MAGILASDTRLSILHNQINTIDPDFLTRLSLSLPSPSQNQQIYLAPSNSAFDNIAESPASMRLTVKTSSSKLREGRLHGRASERRTLAVFAEIWIVEGGYGGVEYDG